MRLRTATVAEPSTLAELPLLAAGAEGSLLGLRVRADGAELFAYGSYPDGFEWDQEPYHARRSDGVWRPVTPVLSLADPDNGPAGPAFADEVRGTVLMADHRSLIFRPSRLAEGGLHLARRARRAPQDLAFEPLGRLPIGHTTPPPETPALSCDGGHLLYVQYGAGPPEPYLVPILGLDPPSFGPPERVAGPGGEPLLPAADALELAESPDCEALYLSDGVRVWVSLRRPCE